MNELAIHVLTAPTFCTIIWNEINILDDSLKTKHETETLKIVIPAKTEDGHH